MRGDQVRGGCSTQAERTPQGAEAPLRLSRAGDPYSVWYQARRLHQNPPQQDSIAPSPCRVWSLYRLYVCPRRRSSFRQQTSRIRSYPALPWLCLSVPPASEPSSRKDWPLTQCPARQGQAESRSTGCSGEDFSTQQTNDEFAEKCQFSEPLFL